MKNPTKIKGKKNPLKKQGMSKISLFLGGMGMLFFAPFSAFAAENLDFAFGKSCPVDAEKCIPEIFSENENEFFVLDVFF